MAMTEQEMQELAEKLVEMKVNKARGYTRRLDKGSALELLRVGVGKEILTRYRLPTLGVTVTLVELDRQEDISHDTVNGNFQTKFKDTSEFVEARVEPIA